MTAGGRPRGAGSHDAAAPQTRAFTVPATEEHRLTRRHATDEYRFTQTHATEEHRLTQTGHWHRRAPTEYCIRGIRARCRSPAPDVHETRRKGSPCGRRRERARDAR